MGCSSCKVSHNNSYNKNKNASSKSNSIKAKEEFLNKINHNPMAEKYVDAQKWVKGDFMTYMEFAFCADKEAFQRAFRKLGIEVEDEEDLKTLYNLYKTGGDKEGVLEDDEGNPVKFSVLDTFGTIDVDLNKLKECNVQFAGIE